MNTPKYSQGFLKWLKVSKYRRTTKRRLIKKHWGKYQSSSFSNLLESYYGFPDELVVLVPQAALLMERIRKPDPSFVGFHYRIPVEEHK